MTNNCTQQPLNCDWWPRIFVYDWRDYCLHDCHPRFLIMYFAKKSSSFSTTNCWCNWKVRSGIITARSYVQFTSTRLVFLSSNYNLWMRVNVVRDYWRILIYCDCESLKKKISEDMLSARRNVFLFGHYIFVA